MGSRHPLGEIADMAHFRFFLGIAVCGGCGSPSGKSIFVLPGHRRLQRYRQRAVNR
jgi:hypothetical protein